MSNDLIYAQKVLIRTKWVYYLQKHRENCGMSERDGSLI